MDVFIDFILDLIKITLKKLLEFGEKPTACPFCGKKDHKVDMCPAKDQIFKAEN